jgi:hypothetical protein
MSREGEEHTTFIIVDDLFCYVSMPYGLRNALPTFVRAIHKRFRDLIRDLIEVYVDDIIVKSKSKHGGSLHRCNRRRGRPSLHLLAPAGTLDLSPNLSVYLKQ